MTAPGNTWSHPLRFDDLNELLLKIRLQAEAWNAKRLVAPAVRDASSRRDR